LNDTFKNQLVNLREIPDLILNSPFRLKQSKELIWLILWMSLGYGSYYYKRAEGKQIHNEFAILRAFSSVNLQTFVKIPWSNIVAKQNLVLYFKYKIWLTLRHLLVEDINQQRRQIEQKREFFAKNALKIRTANTWSLRVLETITKIISPGLFIYWRSLLREEELIKSPNYGANEASDKEIRFLVENNTALSSDLFSNKSRREVRSILKAYNHFHDIFDIFTDTSIVHGAGYKLDATDATSKIFKEIFK
jgi:hypothetical protein